jgi:hypothetical protein
MDKDWIQWISIGALLLGALIWAGYSVVTIYQVVVRKRRLGWGRGTAVGLFLFGIAGAIGQEHGSLALVQLAPLILIIAVVVLAIRASKRGSHNPSGLPPSDATVAQGTPGAARFRNSANAYVEEVSHAGLWCLLFGCFYLAYKGAWMPAVLAFVLAFLTVGISWLIFPFFARNLVRKAYLQRGWIEIA